MTARVPAQRWQDRTAAEVAERWSVPAVHLFQEVDSTNTIARELAAGGAAQGTVVLADAQSAGRGQAGRVWKSPPGLGVWMSLVLRPTELANPSLLPLLVALEIARELDRFVHPDLIRVKWPNDLLVRGSKIGGILCEAAWDSRGPAFVIVGVGVNVLHRLADFPADLQETATSLHLASGAEPDRFEVATALVRAIRSAFELLSLVLADAEISALGARDALAGRRVLVTGSGDTDGEGTALGIAPDGALLIRSEAGALRRLQRGTVRVAPAAALV